MEIIYIIVVLVLILFYLVYKLNPNIQKIIYIQFMNMKEEEI